MNASAIHPPFHVADWLVDPAANTLSRGGESQRVEPKVMQVLVLLASRPGQVVSREELEETVWTGTIVGPDALTNTVIKLRRALNDRARDARFIETIPKTGYRLIAEVRENDGDHNRPPLVRRLSAILYADVAGYSRLTGENEELTHRTLSRLLDQFSEAIRAHDGTVVHYAGDAILAEFPTVTAALSCAVEVQRELHNPEAGPEDQDAIRFRVGINLGEVIVDRKDIYGDGVNVAARLEGLAEPGGICVSEAVRSAVGNKLPLDFEYLGEKSVKNIRDPVRAYHVRFFPARQAPGSRPRLLRLLVPAIAACAALALAGTWLWQRQGPPPAPAAVPAEPPPAAATKPAIAVLPFANVSVDPEEEYFANGMTDDIITDLAKVSGLDVISRSSVFAYKDQAINVSEIGRELGARYILEGSIRRTGERVRINIQLVDADSGHHMWAERYERSYGEFFSLQDEVVAQIVAAVSVTLTDSELARIERPPTNSLKAYDYYLRAEQAGYFGGNADLMETIALYQRAIESDPEFAQAYSGLARIAVEAWRQDLEDVISGAEARNLAYETASRALEIDPGDARAYTVLSILQLADGHHDTAIESARKAVSLEPGSAEAHLDLGLVLAYSGMPDAAIAEIETALRLNPKPTPDALLYAGVVYFIDGQYERSVEFISRASSERQKTIPAWVFLAAGSAWLGEQDEARGALDELIGIYPASSLEYYRIVYSYLRRPADLDRLLEGLRLAGLPQWPYGFDTAARKHLDQEELIGLVINVTWIGRHPNGVEFFQQVDPNGGLAYRSELSIQTGRAEIRGDRLCQKFDGSALDKELCGYVYRNAGGSRQTMDEYILLMPNSLRYFSVDT